MDPIHKATQAPPIHTDVQPSSTAPAAPPEAARRQRPALAAIDRYFGVSRKGSSFGIELLAGASTFLALSYIFIVNPAILAEAGIDPSVSLFATLVICSAATLVMGLWARLPFALATGLEMNGYIAFFAVGALGFTWQEALGMVLWSGVLMFVLTLTRLRERVIDAIPESLQVGLSFSVGIFLVLIAGAVTGLLRYEGLTLKGFGSLTSQNAIALYIGLAFVLALTRLKVPGAVLISILSTAGLYQLFEATGFLGFEEVPTNHPSLSRDMFDGVFALDLSVIFDPRALSIILVLFILDFYGSIAKFIGLTMNTPVLENGKLPRRKQGLLVDGAATSAGAALGTTSVTTFVESAVGIGVGGRTGLTAVVCGGLMLATFLAFPVIGYIPVAATAGALVYVGIKLCPSLDQFRRFTSIERLALVSMPIVVAATFALDKAMVVGFGILVLGSFFMKRKPNVFLIASTALLLASVLIQELW